MNQEQLSEISSRTADQKYIKFISDEGWKYQTEEELAAGYARMVKSEQGEPLTWEEFWAELRMEGDTSAALELYRVLCRHMENGALTAYDLYGYARHRWCIRCPEAETLGGEHLRRDDLRGAGHTAAQFRVWL